MAGASAASVTATTALVQFSLYPGPSLANLGAPEVLPCLTAEPLASRTFAPINEKEGVHAGHSKGRTRSLRLIGVVVSLNGGLHPRRRRGDTVGEAAPAKAATRSATQSPSQHVEARPVAAEEGHRSPARCRSARQQRHRADGGTAVEGNGSSAARFSARTQADRRSRAAAIGGSLLFEGLSNLDNPNAWDRGQSAGPGRRRGAEPTSRDDQPRCSCLGRRARCSTGRTRSARCGGLPITDCTDPSGDPIVVYDQFVDRWILSQFTTPAAIRTRTTTASPISTTGDPTGTYYRAAFITQPDVDGGFFPDYPKYGVWPIRT